MRRPTLIVLIAAALLGAGIFLLRRGPQVDSAPRATSEPSAVVLPTPAPTRTLPSAAPESVPTQPQPAPSATPRTTPRTVTDPARPGLIRGTVTLHGPAPQRKKIRMDADPACAGLHAEPVLSDALVLDAENRVRWTFVSVKSGLEGRTFPAPAEPVILAQVGCRYEPHVLGIQVGQPLVIVNQDPLLHNVHALPFVNGGFNIGQPTRGLETTKTFTSPEIIAVRCDVHPWMSAWVGVVDHPYYAVTDAAGRYSLPPLLPGSYRIEAWQEACEPVSKEIDVTAGKGLDLDFVLDVRK